MITRFTALTLKGGAQYDWQVSISMCYDVHRNYRHDRPLEVSYVIAHFRSYQRFVFNSFIYTHTNEHC